MIEQDNKKERKERKKEEISRLRQLVGELKENVSLVDFFLFA